MLTIRRATTFDEFLALGPDWDALSRRNGSPPFLTSGWISACLQSFGDKRSPFLLAIYDGSELVGIAPLWMHPARIRGITIRMVGFIMCPDTPFIDFIVDGKRRKEILTHVYDYLYNPGLLWDVARLSQWPADSPNSQQFLEIADSRGMRYTKELSSVVPYVSIEHDYKDFLQSRSAKFRKTHRNIAHRIAKIDDLTVEVFRQDMNSSLLDAVASVSRKGWKYVQGFSLSNSNDSLRFFDALTRIASENGWLFVWLLRIGGKPVAMEYDLLHDGCAYALRADYDPAFKDISPGTYLESQILQYLFANNQKEYSTGPGLNDYKRHLTEQCRENIKVTCYRCTGRGRLIEVLERRLIPRLRIARDQLKNILRPPQ